ncbi:MAG: hypothetical protein AB9Q22_14675 [Candidatus Reddybacter sp.]
MIRDPEGKLIQASKTIATTAGGLQTMLKSPLTKYNVQRTLTQNRPVIGSNRFVPVLDKQIIAIHYAVRKNGKVVAVLTSTIEHSINRYAWNNSQLTRDTILQVFRNDYHFIYSSRPQYKGRNAAKEYLIPIPKTLVDYFIGQLKIQADMSPEKLCSGSQLISVNALFEPGMDALFTIRYEPYYRYYMLAPVERSSLYSKYLPTLFWQTVMVTAFDLLLFLMFRVFNREQKKSQNRLIFQAEHDQLTGFSDRYYLAKYFESWPQLRHGKFAILFIDPITSKSLTITMDT